MMAALNAQSPADASEFTANPIAVNWLNQFLASPPDERRQMAQQVQSMPGAASYTALVLQVVNTCNKY
jgi:hemophore-related protein